MAKKTACVGVWKTTGGIKTVIFPYHGCVKKCLYCADSERQAEMCEFFHSVDSAHKDTWINCYNPEED